MNPAPASGVDQGSGEPPSAIEADEAAPGIAGSEVVVLRLGPAELAVPITAVREVLRPPPIARTPFAPPAVSGAVAIRGNIVPVLDLGLRLFQRPAMRPGSLLVVAVGGTAAPVGLLVDAVTRLLPVVSSDMRSPPAEAEATLPAGWVTAVLEPEGGGLITVLDLAAVLRTDSGSQPAAELPHPEPSEETE